MTPGSGFLHWTATQPIVWYLSEAYLPAWRWQDSPLTIFNNFFFFFLPCQPEFLELLPHLGTVPLKLPHPSNTVPVHTLLPAPPFPMVWRNLRSSICQSLVSRKRKGLGCSSPPSSAGSVLSQEPCRCLAIHHSQPGQKVSESQRHQIPPSPPPLSVPSHLITEHLSLISNTSIKSKHL